MKEKEKQFEQQLDSLILLKCLLYKDSNFNEKIQKDYQDLWEKIFGVLTLN